ncbi:MAG TPA: hypothetical protein VMB05_06450 [Solirubrobacteraceae bacterium]|nr:hypothetical protein [Solirubrobacteraceae bacterium]
MQTTPNCSPSSPSNKCHSAYSAEDQFGASARQRSHHSIADIEKA